MKLAVIFPGQGSQSKAMVAELVETFTVAKETFDAASAVLGYDLWQVIESGDERLNQTEVTQPAMLTAGIAAYRAWSTQAEKLVPPSMMAGHSLGEYTALVAAGALGFEDAVSLVETRGKLMQSAVPEGAGAMAAVLGLDDEAVKQACAQAEGVVEAVNFNAPGQVVIAGESAAVAAACALAKETGAKRALVLPVSVPSHSSLMQGAAEQFSSQLDAVTISAPQVPVVNNVHAKAESKPDAIRTALVQQLYSPVRWVESVQTMVDNSVCTMMEAGPGKVLTGLGKRINKFVPVHPVFDNASLTLAHEKMALDAIHKM